MPPKRQAYNPLKDYRFPVEGDDLDESRRDAHSAAADEGVVGDVAEDMPASSLHVFYGDDSDPLPVTGPADFQATETLGAWAIEAAGTDGAEGAAEHINDGAASEVTHAAAGATNVDENINDGAAGETNHDAAGAAGVGGIPGAVAADPNNNTDSGCPCCVVS